MKAGVYSKKEIEFLKKYYPNKGKLWCMKQLDRSEASVRRKTAFLGLKANYNSNFFKEWQERARLSKIGKKRPIHSKIMIDKGEKGLLWQQNKKWTKEDRKKRGELTKILFKKYGHPRGMLGKHHSEEMRDKMSIRVSKERADPNSKFNSKEHRQNLSNRCSKQMVLRIKNKGTIYSRSKNGWYKINKRKFYFRSGWEVVYGRYLEWLKDNGKIEKWEYEPKTFWFKKIKRGVRSYTPDFKIYNWTGSFEFHEVKGYMDNKSKTKIKRMAKYYPNIILKVIDKNVYEPIKVLERMFPDATKLKK